MSASRLIQSKHNFLVASLTILASDLEVLHRLQTVSVRHGIRNFIES